LDPEVKIDGIFTRQHIELKRSLMKLIDQEINPHVDKWEAEGQFPAHEVLRKLGKAGFLGVSKPVEYGGLGLDYSYSVAMSEELGGINCGGIPMAIGVQTDMATPALAKFGSDKLKREFLAPTIAGEMVASIAVSEPSAGSDVANIKTKAEKRNGDYIINGSKMWITNAFQGDWMCMLANTGPGPKHLNKSLIIVPYKLPGVHLARKIDKLGMRCSDTAEIFLDNVRVPTSHLIGEEGQGFIYQMLQFQEERMFACASTLKPLDKLINDTAEYARQRMIYGRPLLDNQVVHFRLAELATEVEALRSMLYRTIGKYIQGEDVTKLASMCKVKSGRLGREVSDSCLQYWGGMGFTNDVIVSRFYRDFRLISIGAGADEVMLAIISKYMGLLPKPVKKSG
jgi:citronellyl-CoA dehydrogenase